MTSTDIDNERDAALGRIFRELLEELAKIEKIWLDNPDKTDADLQETALRCLGEIGLAFRGAKRRKDNPIDAAQLPWPLYIITSGLHDVYAGRYSDILTPITQGKNRPKGEPRINRLKALQVGAIRETLAWLERARCPLSKAVEEIVTICRDYGIKAKGNDVTTETVMEWRKKKAVKKEADLILEERVEYRKALDDFDKVKGVTFSIEGIYEDDVLEEIILMDDGVYGSYRREAIPFSIPVGHHEFPDEELRSITMNELRRFLAATSYRQ